MAAEAELIRVGSLENLQKKSCIVVHGDDRPIAVFYNNGNPKAVDNRCPHMGFPLNRGTCDDGMITCPWHNARFDASSGCTFDLWADDVPAFDVEMRGSDVWVSKRIRGKDVMGHARQRLHEGLQQNLGLICAKAILVLREGGDSDAAIIREIALFAAKHIDRWGPGLNNLTCTANLLPYLSPETSFIALFQAARQVAQSAAGMAPRRDIPPLESDEVELPTLGRWLLYWTKVRHRDAAERTLLTAVRGATDPVDVASIAFSASTERFYADGGHLSDFLNKAFELLQTTGFEIAPKILPTTTAQLAASRGGEESNSWRHPIDLVPLLENAFTQLPALFAEGKGKQTFSKPEVLARALLVEDPIKIVEALTKEIRSGASPLQLSKSLAYAAALRVAKFGPSNELGDWITALHTFTYCNAIHQAIKRLDARGKVSLDIVRGIFHGAMSVYIDRFLNVPAAPLLAPAVSPDLPKDSSALLTSLLHALDSRQRADEAAHIVAHYLALGLDVKPLIDTLTMAVVREDFDFHTLQMLEAGVKQYEEWGPGEQGCNILVAVARYITAHTPTQRQQLQTARIALRLHRGEKLFEPEAEMQDA
jgi:nitrite reductase/ring-hydroxylating ferredoxin subunit